MLIDWPLEFDRWLDRVEAEGGPTHVHVTTLLKELQDLAAKPAGESATFKRVRQSRRHDLWRVAHPFHPDVAVRLIMWFPDHSGSSSLSLASTRRSSATSGTTAPPYARKRS